MWFLICLFTILASVAVGVPIPKPASTLSWAPAPSSRGTLSILFSCAAALGLCVWTGVHLNIEPIEKKIKKQKTVSKLLGKIFWALIALLAPDIVLTIALHQLLVAWQYQQAVNSKSTTTTTGKKRRFVPNRDKDAMKLKVAFFAIMGGFSIEFNTGESRQLYSLKINDIDNVAIMDRIHDYPVSEINDKSKTSGIAKFIACVQAGWTLLHVLGRQLEGINITLLELNTAVHVILAIIMYGVWWQKPADIDEPIIIDRRSTYSTKAGQVKYEVQSVMERVGKLLGEAGLGSRNQSGDNGFDNPSWVKDSVKAARMAAIICDSIESTPTDTEKRVHELPEQIGRYFKRQRWVDFRKGFVVAHSDKIRETIPRPVVQAAFRAAFEAAHETAHETAFKESQRDFYHIFHQLASDNAIHSEMPSGGDRTQEVPSDGDRKQEATSDGDGEKEVTSSGESKQRVPSDTDIEQQVPLCLKKSLDKVSRDTRIVTFRAAFKAAYKAAEQQAKIYETLSLNRTATQRPLENPSSQASHTTAIDISSSQKIEAWQQILVATRAAQAATRSATRQAIRLAALNAALDKTACVAAAIAAFHASMQRSNNVHTGTRPEGEIDSQLHDHGPKREDAFERIKSTLRRAITAFHASMKRSNSVHTGTRPEEEINSQSHDQGAERDDEFDHGIARVEHALRRAIRKAFREQYRSGVNLATFESGVRSAANIAKHATCTGLHKAARAQLERAQELDKKDRSGIGNVCLEAKELLLAFREENQSRESGWKRIGTSLMTAGEVISDQLIHIPGLFRPPAAPAAVAPAAIATAFATALAMATPAAVLTPAAITAATPVPCVGDSKTEAEGSMRVATIDEAVPTPAQEVPTGSPSRTVSKHSRTTGFGKSASGFDDSWKRNHRIILLLFAGLAGIFYGNLHITKWNDIFPTEIEKRLWRISCVMGTTTFFPATALIWLPFVKSKPGRFVGIILTTLLCTILLVSRAYIIVESFISLRALPRDAFKTVEWSFVIPHI